MEIIKTREDLERLTKQHNYINYNGDLDYSKSASTGVNFAFNSDEGRLLIMDRRFPQPNHSSISHCIDFIGKLFTVHEYLFQEKVLLTFDWYKKDLSKVVDRNQHLKQQQQQQNNSSSSMIFNSLSPPPPPPLQFSDNFQLNECNLNFYSCNNIIKAIIIIE